MGVRITKAEEQMLRNQITILTMLSELRRVPGLAIEPVSIITEELRKNAEKTYELLQKAKVVNE